jgi:hypothetical protein
MAVATQNLHQLSAKAANALRAAVADELHDLGRGDDGNDYDDYYDLHWLAIEKQADNLHWLARLRRGAEIGELRANELGPLVPRMRADRDGELAGISGEFHPEDKAAHRRMADGYDELLRAAEVVTGQPPRRLRESVKLTTKDEGAAIKRLVETGEHDMREATPLASANEIRTASARLRALASWQGLLESGHAYLGEGELAELLAFRSLRAEFVAEDSERLARTRLAGDGLGEIKQVDEELDASRQLLVTLDALLERLGEPVAR